MLQTTTTNLISSAVPPCRLVEDEADHRAQALAAALTEATGIPLEARNGTINLRAPATNLATTDAFLQPTVNENAVLMTIIGLGIDPFFGSTSMTATFAAIKAVRDAMERTILRFPPDNSNLRLHIQLGVPPRFPHQTAPMHVDIQQFTPLLPPFVPLLPVEVVVGGLLSGTTTAPSPSAQNMTCTVVACISLRRVNAVLEMRQPDLLSLPTQLQCEVKSSGRKATPARVEADKPVHICAASMEAAEVLSGSLSQSRKESSPSGKRNNIDVLAHISAELHEEEPKAHTHSETEDAAGNNNFKKLPPGMTSKKNKRLFVKHSYRDYSHELPLPDEMDLMDAVNTRTVNAAFPLKLHETLSLIEKDGNDHIVGWLPHGRSFKIHQQKEFVEMILPQYFVMTKKSSFLRQLNLYGFNRLSGSGSDQGSYYHEKFLRGMKFLCRRIHRQKVNGNGIRAAGNPEGEPSLCIFPSCPLKPSERQLITDQAITMQLPSSSPQVSATQENGSLSSLAAYTSVYLAAKRQNNIRGVEEIDRIYEDQSSAGDSGVSEAAKSTQPPASFISASFPLKLHCILDKLESEGSDNIISWLPHGRAFLVSNVDRFVEELMPQYFHMSKYASFQRQLHMYHFQRITTGRDKGAYHHPSFLRGSSDLCLSMTRTRVNGKGTRRPGNPEGEPDFYEMDAMPAIPPGSIVDFPTETSALEPSNQVAKKRMRVSSCDSESS